MNALVPALLAVLALLLVAWLLRRRRQRIRRLRWPAGLSMRRLHHYAEIYLLGQGFDIVHSAWDRATYQRGDRAILLFFHTRNNALRPIHLADFGREYVEWKYKYVVTEMPVDRPFLEAAGQAGIGVIRPAGLAELADPDHELRKLRP